MDPHHDLQKGELLETCSGSSSPAFSPSTPRGDDGGSEAGGSSGGSSCFSDSYLEVCSALGDRLSQLEQRVATAYPMDASHDCHKCQLAYEINKDAIDFNEAEILGRRKDLGLPLNATDEQCEVAEALAKTTAKSGRSDKFDEVLGEYGHADLQLDPRTTGFVIGKNHVGLKVVGRQVSANTTNRANGEKQQVFIKFLDGQNGHFGFYRIYGHTEGIEYAKQLLYAREHEARFMISTGELRPSKMSRGSGGHSGSGNRGGDRSCHNYGKLGHISRDCREHRHGGGAGAGSGAGGRGGSGPRVSAERRAVMAKQPCHHEARGNCTRGAKCWRSHDPVKIAKARASLGLSSS